MPKVTPGAKPAKKRTRPQTVDHRGFYVMSPKVMRAHAAELEGYEVGKATIRFPASKPLPAALVTKLVKARIAENETGGKG